MSDAEREKWNARYAPPELVMGDGLPELVAAFEPVLPRAGRALDLACGEGQLAVWLARRGLAVDAADIASAGLAKARRLAAAAGVSERLRTVEVDLDEGLSRVDPPYALVTCFHYFNRDVLAGLRALLAPGGLLLLELLTEANARLGHPVSARYLARRGECARFAEGLAIHFYREGVIRGRGQAQLIAQRPPVDDVAFGPIQGGMV